MYLNPDELTQTIDLHHKWQRGEEGGVRWSCPFGADLSSADLRSADLSSANLSSANLSRADLSGADLRSANLSRADLSSANLSSAYLSGADLSGADLSSANLSSADLRSANLSSANLSRADLSGADLSSANLSSGKNIPAYVIAVTSIVAEGNLIVWKQLAFGCIAKLRIPEDAERSNATGRKCRAEFADVLEIWQGDKLLEVGHSNHDNEFIYRVGERVVPDHFEEDRWQECAGGIHFFLTRYEAENY